MKWIFFHINTLTIRIEIQFNRREKIKMKEEIEQIQKNALEEVNKAQDLKCLGDVKVKYLGKKG